MGGWARHEGSKGRAGVGVGVGLGEGLGVGVGMGVEIGVGARHPSVPLFTGGGRRRRGKSWSR